MRRRGFTLIELLIALAIAALLAAIALPSMLHRLTKARRADATAALERLQIAQERHRALHGLYAGDPAALGIASRSPEGLYALEPVRWQRRRATSRSPGRGRRRAGRRQ